MRLQWQRQQQHHRDGDVDGDDNEIDDADDNAIVCLEFRSACQTTRQYLRCADDKEDDDADDEDDDDVGDHHHEQEEVADEDGNADDDDNDDDEDDDDALALVRTFFPKHPSPSGTQRKIPRHAMYSEAGHRHCSVVEVSHLLHEHLGLLLRLLQCLELGLLLSRKLLRLP